MKLHIFATVQAENGKELYSRIEHTKLNLTDMGKEQLVYGDIELEDFVQIVSELVKAGKVSIDITH